MSLPIRRSEMNLNKPLNIVFATHGYKPAYRLGGPIISVSSLAESLVQLGHRVTVITTNSNLDVDLECDSGEPVDVEGVSVLYFKRSEYLRKVFGRIPYISGTSGYAYSSELGQAAARHIGSADLVHTHIPFVYPTLACARVAKRLRKPLFYHQRGAFDPNRLQFRQLKKAMYMKFVERPILDYATGLVALTAAEKDSYRRVGATAPCTVIPNGIRVGNYRASPMAQPLGIAPDKQVILFLGRLHDIKGAELLLSAFLQAFPNDASKVLVMAGPDECGLERKLKQASNSLHSFGRVLFPGMMMGEEKLDLLARADVFCLPSEAEGFSMAVLEALASSTPVVISPGCHFQEVADSGAGIVCDRSVDAFAFALKNIFANSSELKAMGARGYKLVVEKYKWETIASSTIELYRDGIERMQANGELR